MFRLFGKKKSQALKDKSQKIFDVFTSTQIQCEEVNSEIVVFTESKKAEADRLLAEVQQMEEIKVKNDLLAKRVQKFINGNDFETQVIDKI